MSRNVRRLRSAQNRHAEKDPRSKAELAGSVPDVRPLVGGAQLSDEDLAIAQEYGEQSLPTYRALLAWLRVGVPRALAAAVDPIITHREPKLWFPEKTEGGLVWRSNEVELRLLAELRRHVCARNEGFCQITFNLIGEEVAAVVLFQHSALIYNDALIFERYTYTQDGTWLAHRANRMLPSLVWEEMG